MRPRQWRRQSSNLQLVLSTGLPLERQRAIQRVGRTDRGRRRAEEREGAQGLFSTWDFGRPCRDFRSGEPRASRSFDCGLEHGGLAKSSSQYLCRRNLSSCKRFGPGSVGLGFVGGDVPRRSRRLPCSRGVAEGCPDYVLHRLQEPLRPCDAEREAPRRSARSFAYSRIAADASGRSECRL